ncbi:MAG: tRNA 2-thiouridine(34) synthase MnmA [Steroidobacteraceae bacterium]
MAQRIIVGLSGGVDSAVAALLLREAGHDVQGLFMSNWDEDEDGYCTAAADFQDARAVAAELGIPLHRASFAGEYRERVFAGFLREYRAGRTPNPDVLCNREIKFGVCFDYARRLGAERIATGHYARVVHGATGPTLLRALDRGKDQSYFLHAVAAEQLALTAFPLGSLTKAEVRDLARRRGLPVHDKKDSTGICFIGERPFREFLAQFLPAEPGPILDLGGTRLGTHHGLTFYTLGQRSGLEIGGVAGRAGEPWYVVGKRRDDNALVVAQGHDHPALHSSLVTTEPALWVSGSPPAASFRCTVKLRYRQADMPCTAEVRAGGDLELRLDRPDRAVTPGQYAVLYRGEECLGGAVIAGTQNPQSPSPNPPAPRPGTHLPL